ncbi:hypothetical protein [Micromonospora sp. NPDC006431]|uniref:hypothetical protein n=1 Tax=Micromonospora sp. NPDC006431 TaxID=3364235 RepID=UPI003689040F
MPTAVPPTWFDTVAGGWPNLLQGLLSGAITGAVAAVVSFAVVNRTNAGTRLLTRRQEARQKLIEAIEASIHTFVGVPDNRPWRADYEAVAVLNFQLRLAAALVAEQNARLAQRVQDVADELADVAVTWREQAHLQPDDQAPRRYNAAYAVVSPLQDEVVDWLGNINPLPRGRSR